MSEIVAPFQKGTRVIYIPTHAEGDRNHPDCEHGAVKRPGTFTSFVLYDCTDVPHMLGDEDYTAQATDNRDLVQE